jgi:hypothetical protein
MRKLEKNEWMLFGTLMYEAREALFKVQDQLFYLGVTKPEIRRWGTVIKKLDQYRSDLDEIVHVQHMNWKEAKDVFYRSKEKRRKYSR